jgi:RNA polymerase sigma factor (sigma-70 family)
MDRFECPPLACLSEQLLRGPKRLRLRQLHAIEFLLSVVEEAKAYPFEFVCHALTGYRGKSRNGDGPEGTLLSGDLLVADLVALAETLSQDANMPIESCSEQLYTATELSRRFDVSTKTIFRWRRRGLASWKMRCADRRVRIYFPDRGVRRFVARHADLVHRGSRFSQLSPQERQTIITRATELVAEGHGTVNAVARIISAESGRAVETIRLILKAYDEAHPRAGVFNRPRLQVAPDDQRLAVWEAYAEGATVESLARRFARPVAWIYTAITQMRAREIKSRRIEFVHSAEFESPTAEGEILKSPALARGGGETPPARRVPSGLPPYLQQLFRIPLLTPEKELALFRKLNYLKYRAAQLRDALDPEAAKAAELDRVEALLADANAVKNEITQANLRLVVSIAKRHTSPQLDFFELVSDGNLSLMRAVDKFDYCRGFKFSTYGSWAIMKNFARSIPEQRQQSDRYQTGREELLETVGGFRQDEDESDTVLAIRGAVDRMLATLDARESSILRQRFGLDGPGQPQTLEQIGQRMGVSKERIRQLESRAMARLRTEFEFDVQHLLRG